MVEIGPVVSLYWRGQTDTQTDIHTDRQTHRQTNIQTDTQIDTQTNIQAHTDKQIHRHTYRHTGTTGRGGIKTGRTYLVMLARLVETHMCPDCHTCYYFQHGLSSCSFNIFIFSDIKM